MSTDPLLPAPPPEPPRFARDPGAERPDPRVAEKREAQTSGRPSTSDEGGPRPLLRRPVFWIVVAVLLTVNWASLLMIQSDEPRVEVPFSPYFIDQVRAGEVESISSKGDTIEGTFTSERRYPSGDPDATPTARFSTEVPSFWDDTELTGLLQSEGVEINAESPDSRPSLLGQLLLGFGPTLLARRAVCAAGSPQRGNERARELRSLQGAAGRSRNDQDHLRRCRRDRRSRRPSWPRSSTSCKTRQSTPGWAAASRTACCCPARRGPARRCSRGHSPGRPTPPSSRSPRPSSSRRSSASAPPASATCSPKPKRQHRRSSSSTSSTQSAAPDKAQPPSPAATTSASRLSTRS